MNENLNELILVDEIEMRRNGKSIRSCDYTDRIATERIREMGLLDPFPIPIPERGFPTVGNPCSLVLEEVS